MHTVQDIDGVTVARGQADKHSVTLTLAAPSGFLQSHYYPAESITVSTVEGIAALRQLCEELLEAHAELFQEV